MSNAVLHHSVQPESPALPGMALLAAVVLAAWFLLVFLLGGSGALAEPPGTPPLPILIAVTAPIIVFLLSYRISRAFRDFVLGIDPRVMATIQAWRFAGLGFLALYTYGVLPGAFAWPAGLGDIAIGVTAPWILVALIRRPSFAASRIYVIWNALGVLDLVVAVSTGALSSLLALGVPGEITTGPMALLPLVLIPAYFVPIFFMLHLAALVQARRLANQD